MSVQNPDRRAVLAAALGAGALYLLPEMARAQDSAIAAGIELGPAQPFSLETLRDMARSLAAESFTPMAKPDAAILEQIDYDAHGKIRFRKDRALWGGSAGDNAVQFFFPGRYFQEPVHIYVVQDGTAREVPFSRDLFTIPADSPAQQLTKTDGFAGFSVQDQDTRIDWMAFLGASYWRTSGYSGQFGLSARGLALDTAIPDGPEEFPRFTRFWLEQGGDGAITTYALLESPRATGAYRIVSRRDQGVVQEISADIFLRRGVARLGLAPLTSMYWFGKHDRHVAADWRPEVHDSDGLEMLTGSGERIWRPLNNPPRIMANSFATSGPKGFGLMQRERDFDRYEDDGVFYDRRASAWVEPLEDWGEGAVTLIELPTDDETFDNIVAFWTPAEPAAAGREYRLNYRLSWLEDSPVPPVNARFRAVRLGKGGIPGQPRPADTVKVVCDFEARGFEGLERGPLTRPIVSASRGMIGGAAAYPIVDDEGWRALFDIDFSSLAPEDDEPIDLRVFVEHDGRAMTETLILQFFPSQLRDLLAASN
ncbi:glucans biosynthesis protein [Paracoccus halophilus]|uniref:Glucan biosynthesis protein D n=1 Tax=Paracoccus halophilus TaxID=376733 RepID=A0A099F5R5_9RHOB|nr:glucan biosynthesis protein D [Paracoccus halophilus]KGJ05613.1 glucan biosynthesis protein D [Paracoccus halophilus]SFA47415.1 glucans biosynthesis protein [Paracoccus halophilus]